MTDKTADNGKVPAALREIDTLFRRADFAAEGGALAERLQRKIRMRLLERAVGWRPPVEEYELSEDELSELAAAGTPEAQNAEALRRAWRPNGSDGA